MENQDTSIYNPISRVISGKLFAGKLITGFSDNETLLNQFGGLLAYEWLYSRKPKNPI